MTYDAHANACDPSTNVAVFVARTSNRIGWKFGYGIGWPYEESELPSVNLTSTIEDLFYKTFRDRLPMQQFPEPEDVPLTFWGMRLIAKKYEDDENAKARAKMRTKFARICF